jgi:thiol:disulfide interchange protein
VIASVDGQPPFQNLSGLRGGGAPQIKIEAQFTAPMAEQPAMLFITADVPQPFHIYSITQPPGGPQKTVIRLKDSTQYRLSGPLTSTPPPTTHVDQEIWKGLEIQEHYGRVTWHGPLELAANVNVKTLRISGTIDTQACDPNTCIPLEIPFMAGLGPGVDIAAAESVSRGSPAPLEGETFSGEYHAERSNVMIRGYIEPAAVAPGGRATLVLSAQPDPAWHIYALADRDPNEISKPTLIVVEHAAGMNVSRAVTDARVIEKDQRELDLGVQRYYEGLVSWNIDIEVPRNATPGEYTLAGIMGYQVCRDRACNVPAATRFQGTLQVVDAPVAPSAAREPLIFAKAEYREAALAADASRAVSDAGDYIINDASGGRNDSLAAMLFFGFLGGLILNVMPCVLPVIGLKIMSFVEQSGESRLKAFELNIWYSLGIISVFLLLATFAVKIGLAWGEQFGNDAFNIGLASVVFAMGLSLLGVWEIPIPGFVGGHRAAQLTQKEGRGGALIKGVITTILATPCTGPFMGPALAWAVRQPPATTYAVFASLGLGMASPYLAVGAFPWLVRLIPKPGLWMVTFKQIMGFLMLGTVIFLLTFIHPALIVPTLTLLTGIGAACWWIARVPPTESLRARLRVWTEGVALATLIGVFSFAWLDNVMADRLNKYFALGDLQRRDFASQHALPWEPFSQQRLEMLTKAEHTVLVDFTADWCATCKALEAFVLNTRDVSDVIRRNRVVTLVADYTKGSPEVKEMLRRLESNGVPVLAIFPAGDPQRPTVFRGSYTKGALIEALEKAGASRRAVDEAATAMKRSLTAIARKPRAQ